MLRAALLVAFAGYLCFLAGVLGPTALRLVVDAGAAVAVDRAIADYRAAAAVPVEQHAQLAVDDVDPTALVPSAYSAPVSGYCTVVDTVNVYKVASSATTTTAGDGPYCSTCALGARIPIAGKAWALTTGGSTTLSCSWVDAGLGFAGSAALGGGGGVSSSLVCLLVGGASCTMTGSVVFSGVSPDITAASGEDLTLTPGATTGSVRIGGAGDGTAEILDAAGNVDVTIGTSTSASFGGQLQLVDTRTSLAATACDNVSETGVVVLYEDTASTSRSFCGCEQNAGVIGWVALSPGGDCTP